MMKIRSEDILRLNELLRDLLPDELLYVNDIRAYGMERITEAVAIIKNYKSDRVQYVVDQLNLVTVDLLKEESDLGEKRKLLNKVSSLISYIL